MLANKMFCFLVKVLVKVEGTSIKQIGKKSQSAEKATVLKKKTIRI